MTKLWSNLRNQPSFKELESNKRLQWLLVAVLMILMLSLGKRALDSLTEPSSTLSSELALLSRLEHASQQPFDDSQLVEMQALSAQTVNAFTEAASAATAEAQALAVAEQTFRPLIERSRISLLGSQTITVSASTFFQVRLELNGQLDEKRFIDLLKLIDRTESGVRLSSMQYTPKAANSFSAVVDMLFVRSGNE